MKKTEGLIAARDGNCISPWQTLQRLTSPVGAKIKPADSYDCIIAGGGITGLSTGLLLQKSGLKTLIAEAHTVGFGTTGGTSAHINTFADTTYKEAENAFGKEGAQQFADAIREGFDLIKLNIDTFGLDCDYGTKVGFLYAENDEQVKQLMDIYKGCLQVGVAAQYANEVPTDVPFKRALQFENQAQFHPLKYLAGLQKAYIDLGGVIYENTRVESVTTKEGRHVINPAGISARHVVYATHLPPNLNVFNFRCAPYRSYVLGLKLKNGNYPDALIYDMQEPYHYVRSHIIDNEQLLILGGNDHKTAHGSAKRSFDGLESYARKYYHVSSIKYRWSSQYYVPVDGLPYVGQMPFAERGIYCATGFNGNGMMLGSISAKILADLVLGKENKYAGLFSPSRIKPIDGFTEFVKENTDVVYHFVADRIAIHETDSVKRVIPGNGKIVEINNEKIAVYRAEDGTIHALSPVCTHAGCIVNWNDAEKTWDCPCHGARYDVDGNVLTGPATRNLKKAQ
jgi:glycine/D-amino acid oxidase-like deaminating enzyme/nitrite reductase/ring-hydroxylating ferredoxin subunit